jgi:hypothetical protein
MRLFRTLLPPALLLLAAAAPAAAAVEVTARFDPPRVALGDPARYVVEIAESAGGSMPQAERVSRLPVPGVEGLTLRNGRISSSQQTNIVNGAAEYRVSQQLIFDAVPQAPGSYRVPSYVFEYKGSPATVPAAELKVLERGADAGPAVDELIFLAAELPETLYVGQAVEASLTLYVAGEVDLRDLGNFARVGDGFSVSELPAEARRGSTIRDGRRYQTLSWPLKVTPLTAGAQTLEFSFEVLASLPGTRGNAVRPRDPFGGFGMFDDFFARPQRFNLYTPQATVDVRPLPQAGRPDSFTGGIGDFSLRVSVDRNRTREGEPVMLSAVVGGRGNFDRVGAPVLADSEDWRSYPPETRLEAADELGLEGDKRFDLVLLPSRDGELATPEVRFAFFDPDAEEYVELSSPPLPVTVEPAPAARSPAAAPSGGENAAPADLPAFKTGPLDTLLALDYGQRASQPPGRSLLRAPWFYLGNGLVLVLLAGTGMVLRRRHRLAADPAYALRRGAAGELRAVRREVERLARAGDGPAFHAAAQKAVRLAASRRLGRSMKAASNAELTAALDEVRLAPEARSALASLMRESDRRRFSMGAGGGDLERSRKDLARVLRAL